jgi:dTDP-4-amino-4,6-dideoxygalactose transaminase
MGHELERVAEVILSPSWNICYGKGLTHETLEANFAEFTGSRYAIAVNTGGMALQMSMRALGVKPGDEVIHQVDTCVANAFAAINAYATPIFADISKDTFMPGSEEFEAQITERTKVLVPIHMWGNAQNMDLVRALAKKHNLKVVEDGCLGLGATWKNEKAGSMGDAAVFSFGCLKPIQTGEGGIITTNDEGLAKELRTIRSYGDMSWEYGVRDNRTLSWNGRISEILAAVAIEQLKGYPAMLNELEANVSRFRTFIGKIDGLELMETPYRNAYTQVQLRIDPIAFPFSKDELMERLSGQGVNVWHANFELITTLSYFKTGEWKNWLLKGDQERIARNYNCYFPNAEAVYGRLGFGISRPHFLSSTNVDDLIRRFETALRKS